MTELHWLSAHEVLAQFRTKSLSPVEYLDALLARAEALEPALGAVAEWRAEEAPAPRPPRPAPAPDRKSTRLNTRHLVNSYAGFCLKKKNMSTDGSTLQQTLAGNE